MWSYGEDAADIGSSIVTGAWSFYAGALGFFLTLMAVEAVDAYAQPLTSLSIALAVIAGSLSGVCVAGALSGWHIRRKLGEQNRRLDVALNNMIQGLCMFDAQNRLQVWNERYRAMYKIDSKRIWRGCTIRDLLDARIAAGTFPLDPSRYDNELRAHLKDGLNFTLNVELADGRIIDVVNQPIEGGGWVATHEDITERKKAARELEHTRSFLDTIIENVPSPIIVKGAQDLRYMLINRAAEQYLGVDRNTMLGKRASEVMPKVTADRIEEQDKKLIEAGTIIVRDEHTILTPGNGTRIVTTTRLPVNGADGKPQYLISVIRDLTERRRHEQQIAHMAHHDALTDLPNRTAFNECIAATLDIAKASGESFALLSIDLDRFKTINDVFGHSVGDRLLREIAGRLELACQGAFVARVGGDEFHVITPTGPQPETAEALAENLCAALDTDIDIDGFPLRVELTVGVAVFPQDGADAVNLIANADAALFRAKTEARGTIRFFQMTMDNQLRDKRVLQQDLRAAIARDELALHYQPLHHDRRRGPRLRGAGALASSHARHDFAGALHPARRGKRPHRADRRMDSAHRLPGGGVLAAPAAASASICRRCSSARATWSAWCIRSCWKPASSRRGSSSKSPRAC